MLSTAALNPNPGPSAPHGLCIYMYTYLHTHTHKCKVICMYVYVYVYVCVCVCVCVCVRIGPSAPHGEPAVPSLACGGDAHTLIELCRYASSRTVRGANSSWMANAISMYVYIYISIYLYIYIYIYIYAERTLQVRILKSHLDLPW